MPRGWSRLIFQCHMVHEPLFISQRGLVPLYRLCLWAVLLAVVPALGCKKHESPPSAAELTNGLAAAPPSPRGPGPMPGATAPAVIQPQADLNATLAELTAELRKYVVHTRSVPKNFDEFIAKSQVQVPAPPPGKKYAIQNKAIVLVNR